MTEQMPGELIYEYTIQSTGATSYGVPALDDLLSGVADIPSACWTARPAAQEPAGQPARLRKSPPPSAGDGGVIAEGDLRADRGTNPLARQALCLASEPPTARRTRRSSCS